MSQTHKNFAANLSDIDARIARACQKAGRARAEVQLVGACKRQDAETINAALDAGMRIFGENRVQEAQAHWGDDIRANHPDLQVHYIGGLQTNKALQAAKLFDCIHSVDRARLADALADAFAKTGRSLPCLIQVNIGAELQKSGVMPRELEARFVHCRQTAKLNIVGFMCVPPAGQNPAPYFARMAILAQQYKVPHLSMGMSDDFEDAIAHGATYIRVGSALFGERT